MSVFIDTTIWSLVLRRPSHALNAGERSLLHEWTRLVTTGQAVLAGPIRQELLSGIRSPETFAAIKARLDYFDYLEIGMADYDQAAAFANHLDAHGVAAGDIDVLICALAYRRSLPIFTTDRDFHSFRKHVPIEIHAVA